MSNNDTKMPKPMSKEEMIDTLKGLVFGTFDRTTPKEREALDMAIKALEQTPPKGKWSRPSVVAMPYSFAYECPICRQWGNIQTFKPNYCPNCGADMRGDSDAT